MQHDMPNIQMAISFRIIPKARGCNEIADPSKSELAGLTYWSGTLKAPMEHLVGPYLQHIVYDIMACISHQ